MEEIFKPYNYDLITNSFIRDYIVMLSISNMMGRFGWSMVSESIGRKNMFYVFGATSVLA